MSDVLIIGKGVVGSNLGEELSVLAPDYSDPPLGIKPKNKRYKFGFVCVDTPLKDGTLDISIVKSAIVENDCDIYVIKSTVPVGFTDKIAGETGKKILFSPEYYGSTQHANSKTFDFTILGGNKDVAHETQQLLQKVYSAYHSFMIVDAKTAELAKLMENAWIATKVTFCCEFAKAAAETGVDYTTLREAFLKDPRVSASHTFVYDETPFWDSHCLNKDVVCAANQLEIELLKYIVEINDKSKRACSLR